MSQDTENKDEEGKFSRRDFLQGSMVAVTGALVHGGLLTTDATEGRTVETSEGRIKTLWIDEVRSTGNKGLTLTSDSPNPNSRIDFKTDGLDPWNIRMRITRDGRVGIGTTTPGVTAIDEQYPILDVKGYASFNGLRVGFDGFNDILSANEGGITMTCVDDSPTATMDFKTGGNDEEDIRMRITRDGNVGIGTTEPAEKLHVQGGVIIEDGMVDVNSGWPYDWLFLRQKRDVEGGGGFHIANPWGNSDQPQGDPSRNRLEIAYRTESGEEKWGQFVLHGPSGRVGIGTAVPSERLHVLGTIKVDSGNNSNNYGLVGNDTPPNSEVTSFAIRSYGLDKAEPIKLQQQIGPNSFDRVILDAQGKVTIGTAIGNPVKNLLDVKGTISAVDVELVNADCAEEFSVSDDGKVEPGTVMVIDQGTELTQCREAYDRKVVGVVSGAADYKPALLLDRQTDQTNRLPIALMGKVFCKVDARYAPIQVGDLLTTSGTCGHAMKATDPTKAFGAVLGKALGSVESGTGLIPILVTLQ